MSMTPFHAFGGGDPNPALVQQRNGALRTAPASAIGTGPSTPTRPDAALVAELRAAVAARLEVAGVADRLIRDEAAAAEEHARAQAFVQEEISAWVARTARAGLPPVSIAFERELAQAVLAALAGLGALKALLEREDVENVHIHGCDRVFLELADGHLASGCRVRCQVD